MVYTPFTAGQVLPAGQLNTLIEGETMPWTQLDSLALMVSGITIGTPAARMRKLMCAGTEVWEFEGRLNIGLTLTPNTDINVLTFNAGYRVGSERGFMILGSQSGFYGIRTTFQTTGQLHMGVPTAAPNTTSSCLLDGIRITNPLA